MLCFTDLHLGKKGNSKIHNEDVLDFISWAMDIGREKKCTHGCFLGDWHDDRTRLDSRTLNYSQRALELINNQDWLKKLFFLIGNHDLFYRHNRKVHSVPHAGPLDKIQVIRSPYSEGNMLFLPYLFPEEYDKNLKNTTAKYVFGHLELRGFIITGSNYKMPTGPNAEKYNEPDFIFSGHFHKRQAKGNVIYIGNGFPMDFGDAGDVERGVMILDTEKEGDDRIEFINWPDCPRYIRCNLQEVLDTPDEILYPKARVRCLMDIEISYDEAIYIKEQLVEKYKLREFQLEDPQIEDLKSALSDDELAMQEIKINNMDQVILEMLEEVSAPGIDNETLQKIYREL